MPRHVAGNITGGHPGVLQSIAEEALSGLLYQLRKDNDSEILREQLFRGKCCSLQLLDVSPLLRGNLTISISQAEAEAKAA